MIQAIFFALFALSNQENTTVLPNKSPSPDEMTKCSTYVSFWTAELTDDISKREAAALPYLKAATELSSEKYVASKIKEISDEVAQDIIMGSYQRYKQGISSDKYLELKNQDCEAKLKSHQTNSKPSDKN